MISVPTVFILGAGASIDYGFPSGKELVEEISRPINVMGHLDPRDNTITSKELLKYGMEPEAYSVFQNQLVESRLSVDAFIENRPQFNEIGRKAIAITLLKCEVSDRLFRGRPPYLHFERMRESKKPKNWYDLLWFYLTNPFSFYDFSKNKLAIITFNYDRSLEHFLFTALKRSSDRSDRECAKVLGEIPIIHIYGSLGPLPWQQSNCVPYNSGGSPHWVELSYQFIKLIRSDDNPEASEEFQEAHRLLRESERIFILGFGFDYTNIRRLNFQELTRGKDVWATCLGLPRTVKEVIIRLPVRRQRAETRDIANLILETQLIDLTVYELLHDKVSIS